MHLVQIFLPLYSNDGEKLAGSLFDEVRRELTERFGGMTGHTRAPAEGVWKEDDRSATHDDIVIFEVMADHLDRSWWRSYRELLEQRFRQEKMVVRAQEMEWL
jgi:hypothetical protein